MAKFRFQDLEIWQLSIELADELFDLADLLENMRHYRFAEQLRGAGLSPSNNIAEGSGSDSKKEFAYFLNVAKRSTFENANMILLMRRRGLIDSDVEGRILEDMDKLSRKITSFKNSLK